MQERTAELQESRQRFKKVAENMSDLIYEWDLSSNTFRWLGDIDGLLGYQPGEISCDMKKWLALIHPDDALPMANAVALRRQGTQSIDSTYRIKEKNGKYRTWKDQAHPFLDENNKPYRWVGICTDITEREKLEEETKLLHTAMDAIRDAAYLAREDGTFYYVNAAAVNNLGYSKDELYTMTVMDVDPKTDVSVWKEVWPALVEEKSLKIETTHQRKDGTLFPVEVVANLIEFRGHKYNLGIARNISERRRKEEELKNKNLELQSREQELSTIIENIPSVLFMKEVDELRFVRFNKAGEALLGIPRQEMIGKNDYDFFPEEQADFFTKKDREVIKKDQEISIVEEPIETATGERILHTKKCVIKDSDGKPQYLLGISEDITERKALENELRQSEARFRDISESTNDWIWEVDAQGRYSYVSEGIFELMGYTQAEILGKTPFDLMTPEEAKRVGALFQNIIAEKRSFKNLENENVHKNGRKVFVETSGAPILDESGELLGYRGTDRNISDRKQAEEKLIYLSRAMESSLDFIIITDLEGKITYVNRALTDAYGYSREELLGTPAGDLVYDKLITENVIYPTIYEKGGWQGELETVRKDGATLPVFISSSLVSDSNNKPIGMLGIVKDLTITKALEKKEAELEIQLQQAQKMEAIGTLAGGIAHDFNNILGAILGYADMARDQLQDGSRQRSDLDKVILAGNRAKELVSQILAFSRQSTSEQKALQPKLIVKEAVKLLRSSIPTTITIEQFIDDNCGMIKADATQFHQIIMNFCTNAYHAMEEQGGTLTIGLKTVELTDADLINEPAILPGPYVRLTVQDTGSGIDPLLQNKIFDPYFTTKEVGKGTGMGLAVIHGIVKNHGGFIRLNSTLEKGTTFSVFFPQLEEIIQEKPAAALPAPEGDERILFVDDEELLADMGKHLLERLGYSVTAVTSSLEAFELIKSKPGQFDLVVTDQTMPGMTGAELAREILEMYPDMPIILCTGYSSTMSKEKALAMGIRDFVLKPVTKRDIAPLIRKVLDGEEDYRN